MKVLMAMIGLCFIKNSFSHEYVFEIDKYNEYYNGNITLLEQENICVYINYNAEVDDFMLFANILAELNCETNTISENSTEIPVNLLGNHNETNSIKINYAGIPINFVENDDDSKVKNTKLKGSPLGKEDAAIKTKEEVSIEQTEKPKLEMKDDNVFEHENPSRVRKKEDNKMNIKLEPEKQKKPLYQGESFPKKYLEPDATKMTIEYLHVYLNSLNRTVNHFTTLLNKTDVNVGLGVYLTGAILKHCMRIYSDKINKELNENIKYVIRAAENIFSHYLHLHLNDHPGDQEYKVIQTLRDDSVIIESLALEHFKTGLLKEWILWDGMQMHDYLQDMDELTLPKERYLALIESMHLYHVNLDESDECISRISELPYPVHIAGPLRRCLPDPFCEDAIHSSPSIAYALSHRMLNLLLRRVHRRCYLHTEEFDLMHLEILCSFMYRETVYIARRGYFARDMFLEHIALCSILGYEEFYRTTWFRKAASWVDDRGCTVEFRNFQLNRTRFMVATRNPRRIRYAQAVLKQTCHHHPMALSMVVLSMGIRYALHRMPEI